MGLAGRDPIFHSQLEAELALLLKESTESVPPVTEQNVDTLQQALIDTCLRCHGAMGLRQLGLDHPDRSKNGNAKEPFPGFNPNITRPILNPGFNPNLFYVAEKNSAGQSQRHS